MPKYKIIENPRNMKEAEGILNGFGRDGWKVVGFTQMQIILEHPENEVLNEEDAEINVKSLSNLDVQQPIQ